MANQVSVDELRPYKSVLVARVEDGQRVTAAGVLVKLRKVLRVRARGGERHVLSRGVSSVNGDSAFAHYAHRRPVAWSTRPIFDRVNHLVVVVARDDWVAIHLTETSRRSAVERALRARKLGPLALVPSARLKAAFIKGRARTLWLKGLHRSTPHKADTKVLGSRDLAPALDPLGDQSYRYTAARCEPENDGIGDVMGVAVDQSRWWVGPSEDMDDFRDTILATFDALDAASRRVAEPLPVLATATAGLTGVRDAYDMSIAPPELLNVGPVLDPGQADDLARMEKFAFGTRFQILAVQGPRFEARVHGDGNFLGTIEVEFNDVGGEIDVVAGGQPSAPAHNGAFSEVLELVRDPSVLTVYFDSGHTIQDRQAFEQRHRDIPFDQWRWVLFSGWDVDREKPEAGLASIGQRDRSLFSWILERWPAGAGIAGSRGWLACDDRPGETADFLHLDEAGGVPILSLIHVKGADSNSNRREIAVVPYETVSAQAVKNLRHLDAVLARGEMLSTTVPRSLQMLAWRNGAARSRDDFLARLDQLGSNFSRRVVIVQPHVRQGLLQAARANPRHKKQLPRLRQLDTMLNGAAANCRSAGAELVVVGAA